MDHSNGEKTQALISVIVPVYNVEAYLDECVASIQGQTYRNLEIILVDDGSRDKSGALCDRWQVQDRRIRVLHTENHGLSEARNAGLELAGGDYIGFVDSDDVLHPQMYERLYESIIRTGCSVSCCSVRTAAAFGSFYSEDKAGAAEEIYTAGQALDSIIRDRGEIRVTVWNKLYRRELAESCRFRPGKCHEDEFWSYRVLAEAGRVAALSESYYGYRQRENSIMSQCYSLRRLDLLEAREERLYFIEEKFPELLRLARCDFRFECFRALQLSMKYLRGEDYQTGKNRIMEYKRRNPLRYRDFRELPAGRKFWCVLSGITFTGTCRIRNILHCGP